MRNLLLLFVFGILISCTHDKNSDYSVPKKVIIAGKVNNLDPGNRDVGLYVNRPGLNQLVISTKVDSAGHFHASFDIYTPTDVWVQYKMNVLVLVQPGDSIYVEFDGHPNQRPQILETIQFGGDGVKVNQDAAKFQKMYFSDPIYTDWDEKSRTKKTYDVDQYVLYLDTLQQRIDTLFQKFMAEVKPGKVVEIWAKTYIEEDYYDALSFYPMEHMMANDSLRGKWSVPDGYYDALLNRLPIEKDMLVSGYALVNFVNRFHYGYARKKIWEEDANKQYTTPEGFTVGPAEIMDSLTVYGIIKYTPDTLLRQMVLTELFAQNLENSDVRLFEKYKHIVDQYVVEPFLKEPLNEMYTELKHRIENPVLATDALLKKLENTSAQQLFDSVLTNNQGKVIYLDCWATWCGPCISEMPNSKKLKEELEGKDVAFVYLCVDSEEELWKASLAQLQIGGQHYFLSKEQSTDLRKAFDIQGIPYYFLIDQQGVILDKGSHLRPNIMKEKILELLGS